MGATCGTRACRLAALQAARRQAFATGKVGARRQRPKCACGCGQRVRRPGRQYLAGHIPSSVRAEGGRKARRAFAFKSRTMRFGRTFDRMTAGGKRVTKEAILDAFAEIDRQGFDRGYHACEAKWLGRKCFARKQAA